MSEANERFSTFHQRREAQAKEPFGSLALVLTQWIDAEQTVWGVAGTWTPRADGQPGLELTAAAADGISIDDELVDGHVVLGGPGEGSPRIRFSETLNGTVIAEDGLCGLRVWDSRSEWIENYGGIAAFDYDPEWVVTGTWKPNPAGTEMTLDKKSGATKSQVIPGEIEFVHDGHTVSFVTIGTGKALQIVFADETNGVDTYSVGRFLFVVPNPDGTVTLDFNLAVLPPCAFSYNFNCPIPPKQNRLPFRVEAGEKIVVNRAGEPLHH